MTGRERRRRILATEWAQSEIALASERRAILPWRRRRQTATCRRRIAAFLRDAERRFLAAGGSDKVLDAWCAARYDESLIEQFGPWRL